MIYRATIDDHWLIEGVLIRRVFAWLLDAVLLGLLFGALALLLLLFGLATLGLGLPLLSVLPFVPFCYHWLFIAGPACATPGQRAFGLIVRRNDDLGRPTVVEAFIFTVIFYLTLATTGLLLLIALFTVRHRTLHDLASGLLVIRARGLARRVF